MTGTLAHTTPKPGTSRRLGLRLPARPTRVVDTENPIRGIWPHIRLDPASVECCDVMHTLDVATNSWLPGCPHLGTEELIDPDDPCADIKRRVLDAGIRDTHPLVRALPSRTPSQRRCCGIRHELDRKTAHWTPGCTHLGMIG